LDLQSFLDTAQQWPVEGVYAVLFAAALLEYVFTPVPGDMVVLAGALLVGAMGWSLIGVYTVVTVGAVIGAAVDFKLGKWLVKSGRIERLGPKKRAVIDDLVKRFEKKGVLYLALNRFFPGIRAFFFVAAGISGYRLGTVMLWSTVSALLWNALLVGIGFAMGHEVEAIDRFFTRYTWVMWGLIAVVLIIFVWRFLRKRDAAEAEPSAQE
jgi:membrane protein DedA with SNARE-associated domain